MRSRCIFSTKKTRIAMSCLAVSMIVVEIHCCRWYAFASRLDLLCNSFVFVVLIFCVGKGGGWSVLLLL